MIKPKKRAEDKVNNDKSNWGKDIFLIVIGIILAIAAQQLFQLLLENHPNTYVYQNITDTGTWVVVDNRGKAIDKVRIDVRLPEDSITDLQVSDNTSLTLRNGGIGENYVVYTIDELWPDSYQFINITTKSPTKLSATVKGYSSANGKIDEMIPVVQGKRK